MGPLKDKICTTLHFLNNIQDIMLDVIYDTYEQLYRLYFFVMVTKYYVLLKPSNI